MDPYYEQRLREEVIYLHSLWHKGPPRPNFPKPNLTTLHPTNPTHFKKKRGNRPLGYRNKPRTETLDSGIEWPCKTPPKSPAATDSGWPSLRAPSNSEPRSLTPEQQARLASDHAQKAALKAASKFLSRGDDECTDEAEEEEDDPEGDDTPEGEGGAKLEFFVKLFEDDSALREYYEKNNAGGEFSCLVCYAVGKRGWKRYKDCVALVQHSISITKTKSTQAHRAYAHAICKLLGWDINRLPSSIVSVDNKLRPCSNNLVEAQENDIGSGKDGLNVPGSDTGLMSISIDGSKGSANNENAGANDAGSALLESNIDNRVNDELKLPECIKDVVNVNSGEVPLENESTNNENLRDNISSTGEVPLENESTNNENLRDNISS
ncbi:PREDICTED: uncharacterized protein LOC109150341 isoform X2 [Ipomoea nil]|uniref:uncharacterized protein LOC109150341 isoform X2 n=1 Tax=Ipomoea nil TaxID=35883 RepID=UPI000901A9ED|nr:PREDICTED: uncharacterized protein LOC109150341 isoform X2 [Ipomoea nil]XP_019153784.1 PREDICTED: uncharacterized protein LOC109150341 isoform X2 [Ipomoea nil]XP_019153785.1 PREDICTED: uncharacterized protein LOC109150341 isoform X2 [Ipomoea nil]